MELRCRDLASRGVHLSAKVLAVNEVIEQSKMSERENRNYERYGLELPVQVRWKNSLGNVKEETGTTRDMSRSGMYIICNSFIDEGCEIDLELDLTICAGAGIKSRVSVGGKVVRNIPPTGPDRGYGHAIIFNEYRFMRS